MPGSTPLFWCRERAEGLVPLSQKTAFLWLESSGHLPGTPEGQTSPSRQWDAMPSPRAPRPAPRTPALCPRGGGMPAGSLAAVREAER